VKAIRIGADTRNYAAILIVRNGQVEWDGSPNSTIRDMLNALPLIDAEATPQTDDEPQTEPPEPTEVPVTQETEASEDEFENAPFVTSQYDIAQIDRVASNGYILTLSSLKDTDTADIEQVEVADVVWSATGTDDISHGKSGHYRPVQFLFDQYQKRGQNQLSGEKTVRRKQNREG